MVRLRHVAFIACAVVALVGFSTVVTSQTRQTPRNRIAAPDCTGSDQWPASMAFVKLKNAGLTDNEKLDFTKTQVTRLASEQASRRLFRQVHRVVFTEHSGRRIEVITVNDASFDECSESGVDVFVVSQHFTP